MHSMFEFEFDRDFFNLLSSIRGIKIRGNFIKSAEYAD